MEMIMTKNTTENNLDFQEIVNRCMSSNDALTLINTYKENYPGLIEILEKIYRLFSDKERYLEYQVLLEEFEDVIKKIHKEDQDLDMQRLSTEEEHRKQLDFTFLTALILIQRAKEEYELTITNQKRKKFTP